MSYDRCKRCGEYGWTDRHRCPATWLVWQLDDDPGDASTIYANDPGEAAEKWAEQMDSYGDYWIVQGGQPIVCVQRCGDDEISYQAVSGESVPQYYSKALELNDFRRELKSLVRQHRYWEAGRLYGQMHDIDFHTRSETNE